MDRHIHSRWTDGVCSVEQILQQAKESRLQQIAITDHVRRSSTYWERYLAEVRKLGSGSNPVVLAGFEAKVVDSEGNLDISPPCAERADFVIGSVHSISCDGVFIQPRELPPQVLERREFEWGVALASSGKADVLGHPGGMSLSCHGRFDQEYMARIMEACANSGTAFEINTKYHQGLLQWLLQKLHRYNPPVSLGSDAHQPAEIGTCATILQEGLKRI